LRLHHLFALTAVAAVLLAINGPQQNYWGQGDFQPPRLILALFTLWGVLYVLMLSVAVTAVAYGIAWQRRGLVFFDQPGHWLLVEIAVVGLFSLVPGIIFRWLFSTTSGDFQEGDFAMVSMMFVGLYSLVTIVAIPLALNIYIGVKKCDQTRWSVVFYLKAVSNILFGLGAIVVFIALLFALRGDRRAAIVRDPTHWCGVWLQLAYSGLTFASTLASVLNMYYMMSRM
jgi:hypothetical protein